MRLFTSAAEMRAVPRSEEFRNVIQATIFAGFVVSTGVFFAEAFPGLFFPFFFPMMVVYCRRVCRWRVGAKTERLRGECSGTLLVEPQLTMMMTFPVAAGTRGLSTGDY